MTTIRIGPLEIPVEYADLGPGVFGKWHPFPSPRIEINDKAPEPMQALALLHECIHALCDLHGIRANEQTVSTLEMVLAQFMRDNPSVFASV
jgi:hypothetical protein